MTAERRLDRKLTAIHEGRYTAADFILADAKDADMAFGVMSPGTLPGSAFGDLGPGHYRTRPGYLDDMVAQIDLGQFDIMLTSASNGEQLVNRKAIGSDVTLAVRANDSTDIWNPRGGNVPTYRSHPFRTVHLPSVREFADLVLYSVTLNNDLDHDLATLRAFNDFRLEAADVEMRYFLEVFNPNDPKDLAPRDIPGFVNDSIIRMLAGVTTAHRPLFLKMAYNSGAALAELVEHDPTVVVGILGGSAGTTRDTFELLHRGEQHGARVALFGRKIQRAESQLDLVRLMRPVLESRISPANAVREYHEALAAAGIEPARPLAADLEVTDPALLAE